MNKASTMTIYIRQARLILFLLGLITIGGQVAAQQATLIETYKEDFGKDVDNYLSAIPDDLTDNFGSSFTYPSGSGVGERQFIITKNTIDNGNKNLTDHTTGDGYFVFVDTRDPGVVFFTTDAIPVTAGQTVTYSVWLACFYGDFNYTVNAKKSPGGEVIKSFSINSSSTPDPYWMEFSFSVQIPDDYSGNIVFELCPESNDMKFGMDDVSVSKKAFQITSPASLVASAKLDESVTLQAAYNNPSGSGTLAYYWEKSEDETNWGQVGTEETNGNTTFTSSISVTEANEKYVYYRIVGSYDNFITTIYSDVIIIDFQSANYIFKYDFGGNWVSSGASGDWWIMPGNEPMITTAFPYANSYTDENVATVYGQWPINIGGHNYGILKLTGDGSGSWSWGSSDDHTFPNDKTKGYLAYFSGNPGTNFASDGDPVLVFSTDVPITTGAAAEYFSFNAWLANLWDNPSFTLRVEGSSFSYSTDISISGSDWKEYTLPFAVPAGYSDDVTISIILSYGDKRFILDDISVTKYDTNATITSPATGSEVGSLVDFTVEYNYISTTINYKWQKSETLSGAWTDIATGTTTGAGFSGTFDTEISSATTGYYRVLISNTADFSEAMPSDIIYLTRADYLYKEDFGGCNAVEDYIPYAANTYAIPAYTYYSDGATDPSLAPRRFIIGNRVFQQYDGEGWNIGFGPITDHTAGCNGYFLQVHPDAGEDNHLPTIKFFEKELDICGGSRISFSAYLANVSSFAASDLPLQFDFVVAFDAGNSIVYTTAAIPYAAEPAWQYRQFEFTAPASASKATFSIRTSDTKWSDYCSFTLDDVIIKVVPVSITTPEASELTVLAGLSQTLTGQYSCGGGLTGTDLTYQWQYSYNGTDWSAFGSASTAPNGNMSVNTTTNPISSAVYYRLAVTGDNGTLYSRTIKYIPFALSEKTYWVCPDNMTDGEAEGQRPTGDTKFPGMVSMGEPGYLPSLIFMEVPVIDGITYKWYETETGTVAMPNVDDYDPTQTGSNDPIQLSDNKSNTIAVQNERNTSGLFNDRTYWVEMCDDTGNAFPGIKRVPVYVKQSYICASLAAVVSPANARRLNRADFGGTADTDPAISQTPLAGLNYEQIKTGDWVGEGTYMVSKVTPSHGGWTGGIPDHIYEGIANEKHGYLVSVNATKDPAVFYTLQLDNLGSCRNIELVFSGWFASLMAYPGIEKANLKFELTNTHTGEVLGEFVTGNLLDGENKWRQFGFKFFVPEGVTSLTLKVVNNNYGTSGGNDVMLDDIEVYLVMPPVTLVPSGDSYICPDYTTVSLKGEYTDDGTLGNYLDYRWEYRATDTDPWTYIDGAWGSVTSGMVIPSESEYLIDPFETVNNGYYRLVVGQTGAFGNDYKGTPNYDCAALSEPRNLILASSQEKTLKPSLEGLTAFCYDDADAEGNITIRNNEKNPDVTEYYKYIWQLNGSIIEESANNYGALVTEKKLKLADYEPGFYTLTLMVFNSVGCSYYSIHEFVIYPEVTTWMAKGNVNNWNDRNNWDNGVPGPCTDVIIPNESMDAANGVTLLGHYPDLIKPTVETLNEMEKAGSYQQDQTNLGLQKKGVNIEGDFSLRPACDTILFRMGGNVARTDYLNYTFAKVDLDIDTGRWYMLSAPLQSMYSGDYFVIGNVARQKPAVYMMKYNTTNPQTDDEVPSENFGNFTNPFNTLTEELYPGLGYIVWVDNVNNPSILEPFRFPKDSTRYTMWNYHGLYMGDTKEFNRDNLGLFTYEQLVTPGTLPNTGGSVGFNIEVKGDKDTYETVMVGNPFMSYLDFEKFRNANSTLEGGYYIWEPGDVFTSNLPGFDNDPNEIAPMQSFIVKKKPATAINSLAFSFDMSITMPASGLALRSESRSDAILQVEVWRDTVAQSKVRLKYNPLASNDYDARKDMWTLFSEDVTAPAVLYALLDGKAASIRTIGDITKPVELGIRTSEKGTLTLRLTGMEKFETEDIYLKDKLTGHIQNLKNNAEYTFDNQTGNVQGRLFLKMGDDDFGVDDIDVSGTDGGIRITTENNKIKVMSSSDDLIETVRVYSVTGRKLAERRSINVSSFTMNAPAYSQVIIVSVKTRTQQKAGKLFIDAK